jgi:hypothetical protein
MSLSENTNIEREAVLIQVNLYKQMREQLLAKINTYQLQNKVELAKFFNKDLRDLIYLINRKQHTLFYRW